MSERFSDARLVTSIRLACALAVSLVLAPPTAHAQQRPLQTADPEPVGQGLVLAEVGGDYGSDAVFPASGLRGSLLRVPVLGLMFGVSSIAQIELTGGPYQRLSIDERRPAPLAREVTSVGDSTTSVVDLAIGAKVRLLSETTSRPSVAFRFSTRLPNSKHRSGLGLNTIDFFTGFAAAKTVGPVRVVGNIGLGILPNPIDGQSENDVLTYGVSLAHRVRRDLEVVAEVNGRASVAAGEPPAGTEGRSRVLAGVRYFRGAARFDAGVFFGTTSFDPTVGATAGVTWVFKGWTM